MVDFLLAPATWYYADGIGPGIIAIGGIFIFVTALMTRFANMFRIYVKTGSLNCDSGEFMDNLGSALHDWRKIPKLIKDFYLSTDVDNMFFDFIMFALVCLGMLMVGGLIPYALVIWGIVAGVIGLAKYMRRRVEMKEEFIDRLKGNR
jgi:hypothetical protein